jgi:hypothetical protein
VTFQLPDNRLQPSLGGLEPLYLTDLKLQFIIIITSRSHAVRAAALSRENNLPDHLAQPGVTAAASNLCRDSSVTGWI